MGDGILLLFLWLSSEGVTVPRLDDSSLTKSIWVNCFQCCRRVQLFACV